MAMVHSEHSKCLHVSAHNHWSAAGQVSPRVTLYVKMWVKPISTPSCQSHKSTKAPFPKCMCVVEQHLGDDE